ncbi:MAG: hypothetical protein SFW65_04805 [Alphaproteobacteria bacterium]|nr:hypothetical protein [Alphaproteobacteria bacterium]
MPSDTPLSIKLLVDHFIAETPSERSVASETALDSLIAFGDVNAILDAAAIAPERRSRFIQNVLQLIANDGFTPVNLSVARLSWLLPALRADVKPDPAYVPSSGDRSLNLIDQLAAMAAMFDNFDAQIRLLKLSNDLPDTAQGFIRPISASALCFALDHAIDASREALLDDVTPFKTFKGLADVAAARCDLQTVDKDVTPEALSERIASIDVLISKFRAPKPDRISPNRPVRRGRPSKPSDPGDDPS